MKKEAVVVSESLPAIKISFTIPELRLSWESYAEDPCNYCR
jgi:hypothetical protein